ncbi:MAG: sugar transporter permease [Ilumatobacteraceae bacterium]|nr:sugar transporter permease [Ilumatobacteraceae bacterium]
MRRKLRDVPAALLMLAPSLAILVIFVFYPLGRAVWLGHQSCDATGKRCHTVGWHQYIDVFKSKEFQNALGNTFTLALLTVPAGVILGIALAVLADKHLRGIGIFRTIFSSTVATSVAVASLIWFVLLQPQVGVLPDLLHNIFPVLKDPGLLRDGSTALPAVAISMTWAGLGFTFIIVTAALQSVPRELYESAYVDGAGSWRRFTNVTLPMLSPTILFVVVVTTTRAFQAYGEIDLLTQGGPNNAGRPTETITYLVYGKTSLIKNNIGLKSASAVLLFVILLLLAFVQFRSLEKRVHYGS